MVKKSPDIKLQYLPVVRWGRKGMQNEMEFLNCVDF